MKQYIYSIVIHAKFVAYGTSRHDFLLVQAILPNVMNIGLIMVVVETYDRRW